MATPKTYRPSAVRPEQMPGWQGLLIVLAAMVAACAHAPTHHESAKTVGVPSTPSFSRRASPHPSRLAPHSIGTSHPVALQAISNDGRVAVVCQARKDTDGDQKIAVNVGFHGELYGDEMKPYLVIGGGPGQAIDAFVALASTGRHVVVIKNGRLRLVDTVAGTEDDLGARGADPRDDPSPFGGHRAATFDADGKLLLYPLRRARPSVTIRDVETRQESIVDGGVGNLWRARLDGAWAVLRVNDKDTNHNGKLEWPRPHTSLSSRQCRGPISSYSVQMVTGDKPSTRVAPIAGGPSREVRDLVRPFGADLLRRRNGALVLEAPNGKEREVFSAACDARLIEADPREGWILAACTGSPSGSVQLYTARRRITLPLHSDLDEDEWSDSPPPMVALGDAVVDVKRGRIRRFSGATVIAAHHEIILLRRQQNVVLSDFSPKSERRLGKVAEFPHVLTSGRYAYVEPLLIDLEAGRVMLKSSGRALALTSAGELLTAEGSERYSLPNGPLTIAPP